MHGITSTEVTGGAVCSSSRSNVQHALALVMSLRPIASRLNYSSSSSRVDWTSFQCAFPVRGGTWTRWTDS